MGDFPYNTWNGWPMPMPPFVFDFDAFGHPTALPPTAHFGPPPQQENYARHPTHTYLAGMNDFSFLPPANGAPFQPLPFNPLLAPGTLGQQQASQTGGSSNNTLPQSRGRPSGHRSVAPAIEDSDLSSEEEGEVRKRDSSRKTRLSQAEEPVKMSAADYRRNAILAEIAKISDMKKNRKMHNLSDSEKIQQQKEDLLTLSDRSPGWKSKVEAYLLERPDLRTKSVHAHLPQVSVNQIKGNVSSYRASSKSRQPQPYSNKSKTSTPQRQPSIERKPNAVPQIKSSPQTEEAIKTLQILQNLNLSPGLLKSMGVDLNTLAKYSKLLGVDQKKSAINEEAAETPKAPSTSAKPNHAANEYGVKIKGTAEPSTTPKAAVVPTPSSVAPALSRSEIIKQKMADLARANGQGSKSSNVVVQVITPPDLSPTKVASPPVPNRDPASESQSKKLAALQEKMAVLRSKVGKRNTGASPSVIVSSANDTPMTGVNGSMATPNIVNTEVSVPMRSAGLVLDSGTKSNSGFSSMLPYPPNTSIPSQFFSQPWTGTSTPPSYQSSSIKKRPIAADFIEDLSAAAPDPKRRYRPHRDDGIVIPLSDDEDGESNMEDGEVISSRPSSRGLNEEIGRKNFANAPPLSALHASKLRNASVTASPSSRGSLPPTSLSGLDEKIRLLKEQLAKKEAKKQTPSVVALANQDQNADMDAAAANAVEMEIDRLIEQEGGLGVNTQSVTPNSDLSGLGNVDHPIEFSSPSLKPDEQPEFDVQDQNPAPAKIEIIQVDSSSNISTSSVAQAADAPSPASSSSGSLQSTSMEEGEVSSAAPSAIQSRAMSVDAESPNAAVPIDTDQINVPDSSDADSDEEMEEAEARVAIPDSEASEPFVILAGSTDTSPASIPRPQVVIEKQKPIISAPDTALPRDPFKKSTSQLAAGSSFGKDTASAHAADVASKSAHAVDSPSPASSSGTPPFYTSPLLVSKSFRFHPLFLEWVRGGYMSLTFSHQIDAMKPFCPVEAESRDGVCLERHCEFQHWRDVECTGDQVILQLSAAPRSNKNMQKNEEYKESLERLLISLREDEVKDFDSVAQAVANRRREFWGGWI